jgi:ring-1,2-phenylacetyl-CoA epoxidase subunit PaaE
MKENKKSFFQKSTITVIYDDEKEVFEMESGSSILEAALDRDLDVPFSCQGGVCTSCMAKITSGEVTMKNNAVLTDEEIEEGYILTCQAYPKSEKITIDYDEA